MGARFSDLGVLASEHVAAASGTGLIDWNRTDWRPLPGAVGFGGTGNGAILGDDRAGKQQHTEERRCFDR